MKRAMLQLLITEHIRVQVGILPFFDVACLPNYAGGGFFTHEFVNF